MSPELVKSKDIDVTVHCSFSRIEKPFRHDYSPSSTVGVVLEAAMRHFEADPEPGIEWYLSHDRMRQANETKLEEINPHDHELKFRLVKETVLG